MIIKANPFLRQGLNLAASAALLAFGSAAQAATFTWNSAGTDFGTAANWTPSATFASTELFQFNNSSYAKSPTVTADLSIGQLLFTANNTGGITFGAGTNTLTLSGISSTGIQIDNGSGAVSTGSANFKIAASQIWLNNSAAATGLTIGGTISGSVAGTNTLTIGGTGNTVLNGNISNGTGTTAITKSGTGMLTLSGTNSYTGNTVLSAGTIRITSDTALSTGSITINDVNTGSNNTTLTTSSGTAGSPTRNNIVVANQGSGTTTLELTAQNTSFAGASIQLNKATTVQSNYTGVGGAYLGKWDGTSVVSGNVGTLTLRALGTGRLYVAGNNTFTGTVAITQGEVWSFHVNAFGGSGNAVVMSGTSTLGLFGAALTIGDLTGTATNTINTSASGNNLLTVTSTNSTTFAGAIIGGGGLTKAGGSTLTLSNSNSFTGSTTINAGRITMGNNNSLGTSAITLNGGTLERNAAGVTVTNNIAIGASGGTILGRNSAVDDYTAFSGIISGSGALTIQGLVTLSNTSNSHSGNITISNASTSYLRLTASEVLGNNSAVTMGGGNAYLRLDGTTETIGSLAGSGRIFSSGTATLRFGGDNSSTSYTGKVEGVTGTLNLVKQGSGTFTLSPSFPDSVNYFQGLTISNGTVIAGNDNYGSSTITLGDAGTGVNNVAFLTTTAGSSRAITVSASGSGTATIGSTTGAGSGNVIFSNTITLNRATTLTAASTDRTTWTGKITGNVGTLTIAGGQRTVFDSANGLNDFVGDVVLTGTGTVLQIGVNTLTGENIPNTASVTVGAGTLLKLASTANSTETINALNGTGIVRRHEGVAGLATLVLGASNGSGSFGGTLEDGGGTLAITKTGNGTQTLSGTNTYTGLTTVSGGALNVSSTGSLNSGNALTVGASGTSDFANVGQTLGAVSNSNTATNALNFSAATGTVTLASLTGTGNTRFGSNGTVTGGISQGTVTSVGALNANISGGAVTAGGLLTGTISGAGTVGAGSLSSSSVTGGTNNITGVAGITTLNGGSTTVGGVATIGTMSSGTANLNGATSTITTLNGGTVNLGSSTVLSVSAGSTAGIITGSTGALTKTGGGTLTLQSGGTYSYGGATTVTGGTLVVNGNISTSVTTVQTGATLEGSGTVGALTIDSGAFLNPGNSPGILTVDGNYSQAGTLTMEVLGLNPGVGGHDQVNVDRTGGDAAVTLGGSLTVLFGGGSYTNGDMIFILLNDASDAISGTFSGLAQNDIVTSYGGLDWRISYIADNTGIGTGTFTGGNDIALMAVPEPNIAALIGSFGILGLLRRRR